MTKEQVQALRDAGISESAIIDRILQETSAAVAPPEEPKPEPAAPPDPEKKQPEPEPEPDKNPAPQEDKILAAIERLTGAVLNRNVNFTGGDDSITESAEDIIGKALRNS